MNVEVLTYPFLFIAVFFEVFLLVTFISSPARARRAQKLSEKTPNVAVIVPCWNEEKTIKGTIDSLLALEYPKDKFSLVLVDDGSTDDTARVMDSYADNSQVTVIHQKNGGKHTAVNAGAAAASDAEFVGCLDADSFVEPDALREIIGYFDNPKVAAVTAAMSVHEPKKWIERMQHADYIHGITLRHVISSLNGLYVTPGPFSFYRRTTLLELGGFQKGHQTEDLEMALRIQRGGYIIENAPRARVYTKTPLSVPALIKQRTRWTTGFLRNVVYDYRDLVGNPKYGTLGLIMLPLGLVANVSGILMFVVILYQIGRNIVNTYLVTRGIPLSYLFTPHFHALSWFYLPLTGVILLSIITLTGAVTTILLGKHISKTPGNLFIGIVTYVLFFGFIAPFWLMRALFDLATGTRRAWR
ncbi:glycosyltransferase family 2 protein [Patescibacteria group bacterium]|nr:glycosyltransferase family 2 protein [Patescibacteria group bacterium]